jgi:hypothetical protein
MKTTQEVKAIKEVESIKQLEMTTPPAIPLVHYYNVGFALSTPDSASRQTVCQQQQSCQKEHWLPCRVLPTVEPLVPGASHQQH